MRRNYGNILTMILVILIVAILGILGYFTYDFFYSQAVNNKTNSAIEEFNQSTNTINKDNSNIEQNTNTVEENTVDNEVVDPQEFLNMVNTNTVVEPDNNQTNNPTTDGNKVMMEDYEMMGSIRIPKTGIELPVLNSIAKRALELSVGIAYGPGLNEPGNTVIFGHNYRNGLFFSNNKNITIGDPIYIKDKSGNTVTYIVFDVFETEQTDTRYIQREVAEGVREISLQTCTDDSSRRIIVCAREEGK